jgi:hypothetical protein
MGIFVRWRDHARFLTFTAAPAAPVKSRDKS